MTQIINNVLQKVKEKSFRRLPTVLGVHVSEKAHHNAVGLPTRAHQGDAGYDLRTIEAVSIEPGAVGYFPTGLNFELPGHNSNGISHIALWILPRTGLASHKGLFPMAWIVDAGYRAHDENGLVLALRNIGQETLHFDVGDRVAQGLLVPVWTPELVEIDESAISSTERGDARLGSSGVA